MKNTVDVTVRKEVSETTYTEVARDDRLLPQIYDYLDTEKQFSRALFFMRRGCSRLWRSWRS